VNWDFDNLFCWFARTAHRLLLVLLITSSQLFRWSCDFPAACLRCYNVHNKKWWWWWPHTLRNHTSHVYRRTLIIFSATAAVSSALIKCLDHQLQPCISFAHLDHHHSEWLYFPSTACAYYFSQGTGKPSTWKVAAHTCGHEFLAVRITDINVTMHATS